MEQCVDVTAVVRRSRKNVFGGSFNLDFNRAVSKAAATWNVTSLCARSRRHYGLEAKQVKLCKRHLELMPFVASGATKATVTCQQVFADRRWNCSSLSSAPKFTADLTTGTREQAFAYAMTSAAVGWSVARACSAGSIFYCGCGQTPREPPSGHFKWGGCGDNVHFGTKFSKEFVDAPFAKNKSKRTVKAAINTHNNQAGRKVLESSLKTQCKCHGVSGACNMKTCWRALPAISEIGEKLKRRYLIATEVTNRRVGTRKQLMPANAYMPMFTEEDLIYVTKSPDYCVRDFRVGSLGTRGRTCNATSNGNFGCDSMCCGRGYTTETVEKPERCHCKYYWCCYVKCKTCLSLIDIHECK